MTTTRTDLHGPGLTDVRMMVVVHSTFRRELRLAVAAVRATQDGDVRRTAVVCDHVELFLGSVHHHHSIEDDLLWDPLAARVPDEVAHLVDLMQEQHAGVHDKLLRTQELVPRWRASAGARRTGRRWRTRWRTSWTRCGSTSPPRRRTSCH